jgi:nitroreductase/NAD-dependent dihydropyrimidine dehydrogenase PreA subunit
MLLSIDTEKCNYDRLCVEACSRRIIEMENRGTIPTLVVGAEELCNNCGHCVAVCPTGALSLDTMRPGDCPEIRNDLIISAEQADQFFKSRRSIRSYRNKPIEREKLDKLVQIAGYAPSGHNARPVHLLVIEDSTDVRRLASLVIDWLRLIIKDFPDMAESSNFDRLVRFWDKGEDLICRKAPHLIIAHALTSAGTAREDCILALAYMELAAYPLGLGATWAGYIMAAMSSYPPLSEAVNLPEGHGCFGALMFGYPKFKYVRIPPRNPLPVTWRNGQGKKVG